MNESVIKMIPTLNQLGITIEYRVMKPSKKPAEIVNGMVLKKIFKLLLTPILKDCNREKVRGNKIEAPKIKPQAASITIPKISIDP